MTSQQESVDTPTGAPTPETPDDAVHEDSTSAGSPASAGSPEPAADEPLELPPSIPPSRKPTAPTEESAGPVVSRRRRLASRLLVVASVIIISALFKTFVLQTFIIPSGSMENTLMKGDRVAVTMFDAKDIERGDVVVFRDPAHWLDVKDPTGLHGLLQDVLITLRLLPSESGHYLIKRVIGMPGDRVTSDGQGTVQVNGVTLEETYIKDGVLASEIAFDVTVPAGHVWVMGDNRPNSADSRLHQNDPNGGFVPLDNVVGVAKSIIWPVSRWTGLGSGEQVFTDVPAPATS